MRNKSILALLVVFIALLTINVNAEDQKDTTTLTGTVVVSNRLKPELTVGNDKYLLMIPRFIEMKDGDTITVEGYVEKNFRMPRDYYFENNDNSNDNTYVFVTKATVNGNSYDMNELRKEWQNGGPRGDRDDMRRGPRGGGMGSGRGPGYCW